MPFDTKVISVVDAENLRASASWIEFYLIGVAYNISHSRVAPLSYDTIDRTTASYEMDSVCNKLNAELKRLGIKYEVPRSSGIADLVKRLRSILKDPANLKRASHLDWLIGNENESFWEKAQEEEVWNLDNEELSSFCKDLAINASQGEDSN